MKLFDNLIKQIEKYPNSFLNDYITCISYKDLIIKINYLANEINRYLRKGQKCAVLCNREINTGIAILACMALEIILIPMSAKYGTEHCNKIIKLCDPDLIIIDSQKMIDFIESCSCGIYLLDQGIIRDLEIKSLDEELLDVAAIMCTSGTTGIPKGVMLTYENIRTNLLDISDYFEINNQDKILISRPLYHAAVFTGEFLISLYKGLDIYFYNGQFNPSEILKIITDNKITVLCGTPTLYYYLLNHIKRSIKSTSLRTAVVSGECLTKTVADRMSDLLPDVKKYNVYGLTEASPRVTYLPYNLFDKNRLSVGRPLNSVECKVVDELGNEVDHGICGELIINAPSVMKGYYRNPAATNNVLKKGWLYTGDLVIKEETGLIEVKSRKDDLIIYAGMNIYPQEIENLLKKDRMIKEVLVYGKNDSIGQRIYLKVIPNNNDVTKELIYEKCRKRLAGYQLPAHIEIVDKLDVNGSGKILRNKNIHNDYDIN